MSNFILEFKNALAPEYCDQLIQKFEQFPHKQSGRTGAGVDKEKKDSLDCLISSHQEWQNDCNIISQAVLNATVEYAKCFPFLVTGAVSTGILDPKTKHTRTLSHEDIGKLKDPQIQNIVKTIFRLDSVNLQKYTKSKGGYHHWHSEHFPHPTEKTQKSLHRVLLWLVYLNDIEEGGETEFYYQNVKIKPQKGSLILAPVNFTYTHRGCVPVSSDKYVLASWLLYNEASQLYAQPK